MQVTRHFFTISSLAILIKTCNLAANIRIIYETCKLLGKKAI